ncbi:MAG: ABC transporter substrate-binding protein [Bacteroidota bacterium]
MLKKLLYFLTVLTLFSCKKEVNNVNITNKIPEINSSIKYAKGFDIEHNKKYTKLIIKSPFPEADQQIEYYLIPKKNKRPDSLKDKIIIEKPVENIVVTSTTHIPMLEILSEENSLIGFPQSDYISSPKTRELIQNGRVKELGNVQDINTEILLNLKPEAVIGFSLSKNNKMYQNIQNTGIPVIFNGDWLEETPLGRAEWIKFFGVLFDKEKLADSIFSNIENEYNKAKAIALKAKERPSILSGVLYKDKWNLPAGESFTATLFKDANTNYLWSDTKGKGSLVLSFESVFAKAQAADFWIGAGIYTSFKEMQNNNIHYSEFSAFKNKDVHTFSKKRGENGGVLYFEMAPIQPHIVLKDIIKVTHPELIPDYTPYFLERLDE